jgi:Fe-S oxidoreductase
MVMKQVYSPGCGLLLYKPELAKKVMACLEKNKELKEHTICCRHDPKLEEGTRVINTCPGCDRRFRELYEGISTISLWEILANVESFSFPDYNGMEMTIHDSCPTRSEERVHDAIRRLLERMNIKVIEPEYTRTKAACCGDRFYDVLSTEQVWQKMKERADTMPREDVVVYCLGCVRAMTIGGKKPRYILDLLFQEDTVSENILPEAWRGELQEFISKH